MEGHEEGDRQVQERPQHDTRDVSGALAPEMHRRAADLERIAADLVAYHARFAPLFARQEQRDWAEVYPRGLLVADVPRKNVEAVAVRLLGAADKDKCQAGVFLGYASRKGATLLDRRLYLPAAWFTEAYAERWQACLIPADTPFQTKHVIAGDLVERAVRRGTLRARGVTCDEGHSH